MKNELTKFEGKNQEVNRPNDMVPFIDKLNKAGADGEKFKTRFLHSINPNIPDNQEFFSLYNDVLRETVEADKQLKENPNFYDEFLLDLQNNNLPIPTENVSNNDEINKLIGDMKKQKNISFAQGAAITTVGLLFINWLRNKYKNN